MRINRSAQVALAGVLVVPATLVLAQQPAQEQIQEVVVTGIRYSLQQSLEQKRAAATVVEVVSAEEIGKLPDKNVADALQRVPGINISSAAGGEGGFDENDRVSIRGTSPSLTQTLVNGHSVASGDWFILDQIQTIGRSVSYTLLPSEIVSKVVVHKSASADLVEGGVAGAVDIQTRKPLDMPKSFGIEGQAQAVYADLPRKTDPQLNLMMNWKSAENAFGVILQGFSEKRHSRRDGQELFGYSAIQATDAMAVANPSLAGVLYPQGVNSALFEQDRNRHGGMIDTEWKPTDALTLDLNGFYSHLDASNYNRSFYATPQNLIQGVPYVTPAGATCESGVVPTSYRVQSGTLVAATFASTAGVGPCPLQDGEVDSIYRPGSASETYYMDFDAHFAASDTLTFSAMTGYTHGLGLTTPEWFYGAYLVNAGMSYALNGLSGPASLSFPGLNPGQVSSNNVVPGFAVDTYTRVVDQETYAEADGEWKLNRGILTSLKFGLRFSAHDRAVEYPESGSNLNPLTSAPPWTGGTYPSNFGSGLDPGPGFLSTAWQYDPGAVAQYVNGVVQHGPTTENWPQEMALREQDGALYAMADMGAGPWRANAGVRVVETREQAFQNVLGGPNPIGLTNINGPYTPTEIDHTYYDVLPSANLRYELTNDLIGRLAAARTLARPDYSALAGAVQNLDYTFLTGSGGNPNLKPIRSNNFETSLEWYFQPRSMISVGAFYLDMPSYVDYGVSNAVYYNTQYRKFTTFQISAPVNVPAHDDGFEISYQQALPLGFGFVGNYTYADGSTRSGTELVGASKTTYNLEGYFENRHFSARLAYTYRSSYLVGLNSSYAQHEGAVGSLDASLSYKISDNVSVMFDALNLTDAVLKYYGVNSSQPEAFYTNGRQYYAGVRVSL